MAAHSISFDILLNYTIPLSYLLTLYILYLIVNILLILTNEIYWVFPLLHYVPALIYVIHKIAVNLTMRNILVMTISFILFPLHFISTLFYKVMFSLQIVKSNQSQSEETTSLLNKIQADNPLNTFLITFTCLQIPVEIFLQIAFYLNQFRHSSYITFLIICNLTICLLLFTNGVVSYFRYETQNINQYILSHLNLRRIHKAKVQAKRTYKKTLPKMQQFQVESPNSTLRITDSHSLIFKVLVFIQWLLHNYIRVVSIGFLLFYYSMFTKIFFTIQTIASFFLLLFFCLKSHGKFSFMYIILQSFLLNFCLIEYKIKLSHKRMVFFTYFVIVFIENLFFNYLWYITANWSRRYRSLFNATILSLIICQIAHFVLLLVYFIFYRPKLYEIDYSTTGDDEENDTNISENEENDDNIRDIDESETSSNRRKYENIKDQHEETQISASSSTKNNVDHIRAPTNDTQTKNTSMPAKIIGHKTAFDNLMYAENDKIRGQSSTSKYKELINDTEEQTVYPHTSGGNNADNINIGNIKESSMRDKHKDNKRNTLTTTTYGVNPEQRESWKYIVEEIDDQIHKSTSNLNKSKLHLSQDRLNKKFSSSTNILDTDYTESKGSTSMLNEQRKQKQQYQHEKQHHNIFETSQTKSFTHIKQSPTITASHALFGTSVDPIDLSGEELQEEIIMENKYVDSSNLENRRTSRYSSQEFTETRRTDEKRFEERKMNVKSMNTTSLV